ncbi:MAG: type II toxin-antitoxin system VapC family toxin [Acidimicrobiales bacterium]
MIVIDASVLVVGLCDDGGHGLAARRRIADERLVAPHLVDVEVVSAWRRLVSAGEIPPARFERALEDLDALRIERVPHGGLLGRCWELRDNLTVYDAVYVALAERLGMALLTLDRRLAAAPGTRCEIEVLSP